MLQVMAGPDSRDLFSIEDRAFDFVEAVRRAGRRRTSHRVLANVGFNPIEREVTDVTDRAAARSHPSLARSSRRSTPIFPTPRGRDHVLARVRGRARGGSLVPNLASPDDSTSISVSYTSGKEISAFDFYRAAVLFRGEFYWRMHAFFETFDLLLTPTLSVVPFPHLGGAAGPSSVDGGPIEPFAGWHLTYPFNLTGQPAISIPCGFSSDGLPIGLQIAGRRHADAGVLEQQRPTSRPRRGLTTGRPAAAAASRLSGRRVGRPRPAQEPGGARRSQAPVLPVSAPGAAPYGPTPSWIAWHAASTRSSSHGRPTTWTPIGRPSLEQGYRHGGGREAEHVPHLGRHREGLEPLDPARTGGRRLRWP